MKDKVVVVTRNPVGGIRTYFSYLFSKSEFKRWDKWLVAPKVECDEIYRDYFEGVAQTKEGSSWSFVLSFLLVVFKIRPKLIHSHGLTTGVIVSCFTPFLFGVKHIITLHDVFSDYHFMGWKGRLRRLAVKYMFRRVDVINPCGNDVTINLREFFPDVPLNKIFTIRNGINTRYFNDAIKRDLKNELGIEPNEILFGFFGRFMNQKGFDLIRKAVKLLDADGRVGFKVVCFGGGGFIREEKSLIIQEQTESIFHFMPHTSDMGSVIKGVDCALIPSRWEACPLLPMEVMCCGVPLITSDCIGMREICTQNTPAIRIPTGQESKLVEAILEFIGDSEIYKKDAQSYVDIAVTEFSSDKVANKLIELYDRTVLR